ncbi:MAG: hypothetical protein HYW80_00995 [Parcubacteria group bacterium]|nr:hypothetical protein [Parcubacteria group bacterium]
MAKFFIDTANIDDIKSALDRGFVGVTTNPSLLSKEPKGNYMEHLKRIVELLRGYHLPNGTLPSLSVEVFTNEQKEMVRQAKEFRDTLDYPGLAVKIHVLYQGQDNLSVIRELSREGIPVNCTACMTVYQAVLAAAAGAKYVSLLWGRIKDGGTPAPHFADHYNDILEKKILSQVDFDPKVVVSETRHILDKHYPKAKIIVGSIRSPLDIKEASLAGAHIVTFQPKFLPMMAGHFKTEEIVEQFFTDFKQWLS